MTIRGRLIALSVAGTAALGVITSAGPDSAAAAPAPDTERVEVFGHRGASGYRPEHTLASYELAARMGADYIEPDLVPTKDGALVARHENEIGGTTDVAEHPEFASRKATKVIDGTEMTGWFTEDFTLAELKTLRAKERIPDVRQHNTVYDGLFEVPTFQEVLDLRERLSKELGREIGVAPETKHPSYFRKIGHPLEPGVVEALDADGLNERGAKVVVQSFEVGNLKELREQLRVELVQLISNSGAPQDFIEAGDPRTYADLVTPEGLKEIATYADVIGPDNQVILPVDESDHLTGPTAVVADAHAAGLKVVPYTVRAENTFLPADFRSSQDPAQWGDVLGYFHALYDQGVDGVFSDMPDLAITARDQR
ncbi:glycerophosphodiester phosphodiesterase [Saccharopolyspora dendranthemae]|uniref:glycerophosphodiester phosphodiesterase n=1 Tax=Saccharopolyspora dendranthemae TaxID=1181886 RepID=A0A561U5W6_9PSEU|nr:glycerophosphodiester phosphodiesterase [Saccharopolyspora dendranthemae]TWF94758.1 glycerophosphoryl diester phosphodiesterase [Saccharopolyspora dendranthemae]